MPDHAKARRLRGAWRFGRGDLRPAAGRGVRPAASGPSISDCPISAGTTGITRSTCGPIPNDATGRDTAPIAPGQNEAAALLYPNLALSAIFQNIFWPTYSSPWPFSYQAIFTTAFAKRLPEQIAAVLSAFGRRQSHDRSPAPGGYAEPDQEPLLQRLGGAIGAASGFLAKSCPTAIPSEPVARMQLMQSQIEELAMAVDMIRQPLQDFAAVAERRAESEICRRARRRRGSRRSRPTPHQPAPARRPRSTGSARADRPIGATDRRATRALRRHEAGLQPGRRSTSRRIARPRCRSPPFGRMEAIGARLDAT